eukprot:CAMPEP_0115606970 /NCGR_PEP_ID=MMETSP0272-20121206/18265_1 /TAXON_ID=71861 /ORGANISM="Scrippsiella trochoidea, Strain CCMP3099" /LENGTH=78 /DNA_ID=CAMNT_0003042635 /DNA_START=127 /DNA_END=365 /DNA_ORIENTATION=+
MKPRGPAPLSTEDRNNQGPPSPRLERIEYHDNIAATSGHLLTDRAINAAAEEALRLLMAPAPPFVALLAASAERPQNA